MNMMQRIEQGEFNNDKDLMQFRKGLEASFPTSKFSKVLLNEIYDRAERSSEGEGLDFFVQEYSALIDLVLMVKMDKGP